MAQSLYRKYRPQTFDDVVGQEHIERTLRNAVAEGNVSHAYLFTGPRGTGKTTSARLLAKALLCEKGPTSEPDGTCAQCLEVADGVHPDVYELDAASRTGVENVREEIIGRVQFAPTRGRYKVYIIDEVHMLSTAAFNALLKTLEEPPSHVVFILCTTDPHKVPETIHSRCQRFDFHRIANEDIVAHLRNVCGQENISYDAESLALVAKHSAGGMRDALTTLEQLAVFTGGNITFADAEGLLGATESGRLFDIAELIARRDVAGCFRWVASFTESGTDLAQFAKDLTSHMRDLYVASVTGGEGGVIDADPSTLDRYRAQAALFGGSDRLSRILLTLGDLSSELRVATDPRLSFEIAFTRMARPDSDITLETLAERIAALEAGRLGGGFAPTGAAPAAVSANVQAAPVTNASPSAVVPQPASSNAAQPVGRSTASAAAQPAGRSTASAAAPTQQASPTPAVSSANASEPITAESLTRSSAQRLWTRVVADVKKNKAAYGAMFANTRASVDDTGTLVIEFPAGQAFSVKLVEKADMKELVSSCIEQVAGTHLNFRYTVRSGPAQTYSSVAPTTPSFSSIEAPEYEPVPDSVYESGAAPSQVVSKPRSASTISPNRESIDDQRDAQGASVAPSATPVADDNSLAQLLSSSFGNGVVIQQIDK